MTRADAARARVDHDNAWRQWVSDSAVETVDTAPVSYTHLTLPTIYSV